MVKSKRAPGLKAFISRCYKATPRESHDALAVFMKDIVTQAIASKTEWSIDWDNVPVPFVGDGASSCALPAPTMAAKLTTAFPPPPPIVAAPPPPGPPAISPSAPARVVGNQGTKRTSETIDVSFDSDGDVSWTNGSVKQKVTSNFEVIDLMEPALASPTRLSKKPRQKDIVKAGPLKVAAKRANGFEPSKTPKGVATKAMSPVAAAPYLGPVPTADSDQLAARRKRFENSSVPHYVDEHSLEPVVGTCEEIEKRYLRLTAAPNPAKVRPKRVLKKAFNMVVEKYGQDQNYTYALDQLKSIRQDLSVQHIVDGFTVKVYETNARAALENSDLGEFNQCQTKLTELYSHADLGFIPAFSGEFFAYQLFYLIHTGAATDLSQMVLDLETAPHGKDAIVQHALEVVDAYSGRNWTKLFTLYKVANKQAKLAMDLFINRERLRLMATLAKAIKPTIEPAFIQLSLGFDDVDQVIGFLTKYIELNAEGKVDSVQAFAKFDAAQKQAWSKVDIKGQI